MGGGESFVEEHYPRHHRGVHGLRFVLSQELIAQCQHIVTVKFVHEIFLERIFKNAARQLRLLWRRPLPLL